MYFYCDIILLNFFQCVARLKIDGCITSEDILEIAGVLKDKVIEKLIDTCSTGSFERVEECVQVSIDKIFKKFLNFN